MPTIKNNPDFAEKATNRMNTIADDFKLDATATSCGNFQSDVDCTNAHAGGQAEAQNYVNIFRKIAGNVSSISNTFVEADSQIQQAYTN